MPKIKDMTNVNYTYPQWMGYLNQLVSHRWCGMTIDDFPDLTPTHDLWEDGFTVVDAYSAWADSQANDDTQFAEIHYA